MRASRASSHHVRLGDAPCHRRGRSLRDLLVAITACTSVVAVLIPLLLRVRETARRQSCRDNLQCWTIGLQSYHEIYSAFPPAAVWSTEATLSLALHSSKKIDQITHENWATLMLPMIGHEDAARRFTAGRPIGSQENASARTTWLQAMTCPSDSHNRHDNPYRFCPSGTDEGCMEFSRGNYGINGGTHNGQWDPPDTTSSRGDGLHLEIEPQLRTYRLWGNGIAGFNRSFSLDEFANGQSTLVALEELRAGIHPMDPRGVWALGQIGGSITWAHGVNGDAYAPNNPWPRSDDILGCGALHEILGPDVLAQEGMPCTHYIDANQQAASRSQHPGGVQVSFLDGSVRFIADQVDPGLWHVMHSRETPAHVLAERWESHLAVTDFLGEAGDSNSPPEVSAGDADQPAVGADGPSRGSLVNASPYKTHTRASPRERFRCNLFRSKGIEDSRPA